MSGLFRQFLTTSPGLYQISWRIREYHLSNHWDAFVLSYPKSGRTWLRAMIGKIVQLHWELPSDFEPIEFGDIPVPEGIPRIRFAHEDNPHLTPPWRQQKKRNEFRSFPVVLMVRDPRDVMVSNYFQATRRDKYFTGSLTKFIHSRNYGITPYLQYLQTWQNCQKVPKGFLCIRYEDLQKNAAEWLQKIINFWGWENIDATIIDTAVSACSFKNMHKLEKEGAVRSGRLAPGNQEDAESYKVRRGIVGGYKDYLSSEDVEFIEKIMAERLSPEYGYP